MYCKQLAREALADDAVVAAINKDFVPVLLDLDNELDWKKKHGVTNIPIIHWTDGEGEVMASTEDVQPPERILEDLATTLEFLAEFGGEEVDQDE